MTRRIPLLLMLVSLGLVACNGASVEPAVEQADAGDGTCAAYEALRRVDAQLLSALDTQFRTFDFISVEWRHAVGLVRVEMWSLPPEEAVLSEAWGATHALEVVRLGHSQEQDGGWNDAELQAGIDLVDDAQQRCGVDLSAGFLALRIGA